MSTYEIKERTKQLAKQMKVDIKPSTNKRKKIDVYKDGELIAQIGSNRSMDYPTYLELEQQGEVPVGTAAERKRLFYKRHKYDKTPNQHWSQYLLWR